MTLTLPISPAAILYWADPRVQAARSVVRAGILHSMREGNGRDVGLRAGMLPGETLTPDNPALFIPRSA